MAQPGAGALNKRVTFQREKQTPDGMGGYAVSWQDELLAWAQYRPDRGREVIDADRLSSTAFGILTVRASTAARRLTPKHRVLVDGVPHQIRSIGNPDQRGAFLEMIVERGVAS